MAKIPNVLTVFRFLLIPVFGVAMGNEQYRTALLIYLVANGTDVLDGFLARKFNVVSNFGKLMDPAADKFLQVTALIMLSVKGIIPKWLVFIFLTKEMLMIIVGAILYRHGIIVSSSWYGKLATVITFSTIIFMICDSQVFPYFGWSLPAFGVISNIMMILTIIAITIALVGYGIEYRQELKSVFFEKNKAV